MKMPTFELTLNDFTFPKTLPESRSTFRFLIDLRYIDSDGKFATTHAVLPGLDSYWECEKQHKGEANFVRHPTLPKLDMNSIDEWDRMIVMLKATSLHSLQIRVIDIEKTGGFLDKIKDYAGAIVEALIGKATSAVTGAVVPPTFLKDVFGHAVHDVEAFALSQLAGAKRQDSLIFKKGLTTSDFPASPGGALSLKGSGTAGEYQIDLNVKIT
jgi:hypothetical protein